VILLVIVSSPVARNRQKQSSIIRHSVIFRPPSFDPLRQLLNRKLAGSSQDPASLFDRSIGIKLAHANAMQASSLLDKLMALDRIGDANAAHGTIRHLY
jgi:hypothetical protein